ncbi:hypothetical protein BgiBS90_030249, partial [Biomphalaria glabrata]
MGRALDVFQAIKKCLGQKLRWDVHRDVFQAIKKSQGQELTPLQPSTILSALIFFSVCLVEM